MTTEGKRDETRTGGRGRRRPPTIDGTAEAVIVADAPAEATPAAPASAAPPESAPVDPVVADLPPAAEKAAPTAAPAEQAAPPAESAASAAEAAPASVAQPARRPGLLLPVLAAALVGGVVAFGVTRLAPQTGNRTAAPAATAVNIQPLESRLAALEKQAGTIDSRLKAAEQRPAQAGAAPADDKALATATQQIDKIRGRLDGLAEKSALDSLSGRLDKLQQDVTGLGQQAQKLAAATVKGSAPAELALTGAIRRALEAGRPYARELTALQALGAPADTLAPLQPLADKGAPRPAALARSFDEAAAGLVAKPAPAANESVMQRLLDSASHLVKVTPVGTPTGDDTAAVLARARAAIAAGDAPDLAPLPAASQAKLAPVLDAVKARRAALAALDALDQQLFAAIAGEPARPQ